MAPDTVDDHSLIRRFGVGLVLLRPAGRITLHLYYKVRKKSLRLLTPLLKFNRTRRDTCHKLVILLRDLFLHVLRCPELVLVEQSCNLESWPLFA